MDQDLRFIHLLYVPTMACNMACKYCYLEDETKDIKCNYKALDTLKYAIDKFKSSNVIPFNISLHGGEVTVLSKDEFHDIIEFISNYYNSNKELFIRNGFKVLKPHIKTNILELDKHIDTIREFEVTVSGSLDLPLRLHNIYRVTKGGAKTLDRILDNIKLIDNTHIKVSSTIFKEHFKYIDEIVDDIKYLDENTKLDMNDFNFMIGFDYNSNGILHALDEDEMVEFYDYMHKKFDGTNLDKGVNGAWFNEFGPDYCTNCDNCGDKFFLLEKNGDIYSCVRGQKNKDYYYGNIYKDEVSDILRNAHNKIMSNHNKIPMSDECLNCKYLYVCKTGCPFVKNTYMTNKSYTCKLQQKLYESRHIEEDPEPEIFRYHYLNVMHPDLLDKYGIKNKELIDLINKDANLKYIYDDNTFKVICDGEEYPLESQILKNKRDILYLTEESEFVVKVRKSLLDELSEYPENNSLTIILLSGDSIVYGDEGRLKQRHIMTHQIYKGSLSTLDDEYYSVDLMPLIKLYKKEYSKEFPNNILFTTNDLRNYHYIKQKNNAYYHINAINLPFQNIEFYLLEDVENDQ